MKIIVQADQANDALYLAFTERAFDKGCVARTVRVSESVSVDLGQDGELIGLDLMSASAIVGDLSVLSLGGLVGVKEASGIVGVRPSNFVRDHASRKDFPAPVAELATGRVWMTSQVEDYARSRRGQRRSRGADAPPASRRRRQPAA